MGILTNPNSNAGGSLKKLLVHYYKISWGLYFCGLIFFFILIHPEYSSKTYFSENALLPGLVQGEFTSDMIARSIFEDLKTEHKNYPKALPYPYIRAKFLQSGLEVYTHTFTLKYPLGDSNFTGTNIYAILRAQRASSTEALVLSVPYRPPVTLDSGTEGSMALLLTMASFFRKANYWAKDIIFLVTEHEQLGAQAWLEAYHGTSCGSPGILDSGSLEGRAGSIQAAINLEIPDNVVSHFNVKVEGLNGQLPNLDLFNLVNRVSAREGVRQMFQGIEDHGRPSSYKGYLRMLSVFTSMMMRQASCVPSGNHGLYHRFGIEAVTIEGVNDPKAKKSKRYYEFVDFMIMGRIIEGIFRSLNNLLERFHQSFFFYLLPSSTRYVSIGVYMPAIGILGSGIIFCLLGLWFRDSSNNEDETEQENKFVIKIKPLSDLTPYIPAVVACHVLGLVLTFLPLKTGKSLKIFGISQEDSPIICIGVLSFVSLIIIPVSINKLLKGNDWRIFKCFGLLETGLLCYSVSLYNFSLAFIMTALVVPIALLSGPCECIFGKWTKVLLTLLVHPMVIVLMLILLDASRLDEALQNPSKFISLSLLGLKRMVTQYIIDEAIYGNVLYSLTTLFYFPIWNFYWALNFMKPDTKGLKEKKE